jgi:hypothetical protein
VDDVALEQFDPLGHGHVGQFGGREIGERLAGLMDGGPLLLLENRMRDITNGDDQSWLTGAPVIERRGMEMEVAVVGGPQCGGAGAVAFQCRPQRRRIGPFDVGPTERVKEVHPLPHLLPAPMAKLVVGPLNRAGGIHHGHTVRQVGKHLRRLIHRQLPHRVIAACTSAMKCMRISHEAPSLPGETTLESINLMVRAAKCAGAVAGGCGSPILLLRSER